MYTLLKIKQEQQHVKDASKGLERLEGNKSNNKLSLEQQHVSVCVFVCVRCQ